MSMRKLAFGAIAVGLSIVFNADAVAAQGNGRGNQRDRPQIERDRDRGSVDGQRIDDLIWGRTSRGNGAGKVPPGWCRGVGNPHNTRENCGYTSRGDRDRYLYEDDRGRYDDRGLTYEDEHRRFHSELDRYYGALAARRPLDVGYRLELELEKRREHDEWHRRMGTSHR